MKTRELSRYDRSPFLYPPAGSTIRAFLESCEYSFDDTGRLVRPCVSLGEPAFESHLRQLGLREEALSDPAVRIAVAHVGRVMDRTIFATPAPAHRPKTDLMCDWFTFFVWSWARERVPNRRGLDAAVAVLLGPNIGARHVTRSIARARRGIPETLMLLPGAPEDLKRFAPAILGAYTDGMRAFWSEHVASEKCRKDCAVLGMSPRAVS